MKEQELIPCNIGTADLAAEFVDELFDDCEFIDKHGLIVGFVCGDPVHLMFRGGTNRITVEYGDVDDVLVRVREILQEMDNENPDPYYRHIAKCKENEITIWYEHK